MLISLLVFTVDFKSSDASNSVKHKKEVVGGGAVLQSQDECCRVVFAFNFFFLKAGLENSCVGKRHSLTRDPVFFFFFRKH